ncbi:hypothetical protein GpartN1_g1715.t1 [Galdieria partita]|uniref:3-hydroxyisobutyrate dehydrogenase n=1 Tax=Galdieria partita TaxID=83374 RepID=A0A9C7UNH8_9RHOD|nr:hypothetical protein GpartN1_g1715.t1 [Galdieria partita]
MQRIGYSVLQPTRALVFLGWRRSCSSTEFRFFSTQATESQSMEVIPGKTNIGWIGTGVMGVHMARHCMDKGYGPFYVYNRTIQKAQPLVEKGATVCKSPKELAQHCDIVFTMVGYPHDVRQVILDESSGVLAGLKKGGVVIDLTTSEPSLAKEISDEASSQGKYSLDAPVTGGDVGAKNGTLVIFVGGSQSAYESVSPLLGCFGKTIKYFGEAGSGQHAKLANQITIASNMIGMCEGLIYAFKAGLNLETYLSAILSGGAASFSLQAYSPRIMKRDMAPGFYVEHFVKDLGIALAECQRMRISLPGLALAQQLYVSLMANGGAKKGTQALIETLESLNGCQLPKMS